MRVQVLQWAPIHFWHEEDSNPPALEARDTWGSTRVPDHLFIYRAFGALCGEATPPSQAALRQSGQLGGFVQKQDTCLTNRRRRRDTVIPYQATFACGHLRCAPIVQ